MVRKLAVAVGLVGLTAGSAGAWEVAAGARRAWTVTTIREMALSGRAFVTLADDPTEACAAIQYPMPNAFQNHPAPLPWVYIIPNVVNEVPQVFGIVSFAKVNNVRIYAELGEWNGQCTITAFHTCFDANSCPVPPAPNP